jgi:hypothetical protein
MASIVDCSNERFVETLRRLASKLLRDYPHDLSTSTKRLFFALDEDFDVAVSAHLSLGGLLACQTYIIASPLIITYMYDVCMYVSPSLLCLVLSPIMFLGRT